MRACVLVLVLAACHDSSNGSSDLSSSNRDLATAGSDAASACPQAADTTATSTASTSGCHVLDRDTSACSGTRTGLPAFWQKFSCRVTLTSTNDSVTAAADGEPDYLSNYYAASDPCHEDYTGGVQNPNTISKQSLSITFPRTPGTTETAMGGGVVGLALNGVPIFGNFAAPGDDIYQEARTFDRCGGHPQMNGQYHYHGEPYAISDDDDRLIGVLRDGYPVYGRRDSDGSVPTDLDADGGHTGTTPDSTTPVYHYHLSLQTSTNTQTLGNMQWFLTTGHYHGTPGVCTGCM